MRPISEAMVRNKCRRGLLELDLVLRKFCDTVLPDFTQAERDEFYEFLGTPDQILWDWVLNQDDPTDSVSLKYIKLIRDVEL